MRKKLIIVLICILVGIFMGMNYSKFNLFLGLFPPSIERIEKIYYNNTTELSYISKWLIDSQFTNIRIDIFDAIDEIECSVPNDKGGYEKQIIKITDSNLIDGLTVLKDREFIRIIKEYNYVYFQVWGSFGGSIGFIFSENQEPDVSKINAKTKVVEKLPSTTNWYYYKEMFE